MEKWMSETLGQEVARDRVHAAAVVDVVRELEVFEVPRVEGRGAGRSESSDHVGCADGRQKRGRDAGQHRFAARHRDVEVELRRRVSRVRRQLAMDA